MPLTLTDIRTHLATRLSDPSNLIYSLNLLDESIRSALADISRVSGAALTLTDLDGALETTLPPEDEHALITGAVAYALIYHASGRFDDAVPDQDLPIEISEWAEKQMSHFLSLLSGIKKRIHQTSEDIPYSQWDWDES
jgi:hypothetical protein